MAIDAMAESRVVGHRKIIFGQERRMINLGLSELGIFIALVMGVFILVVAIYRSVL